MLSPKYMCPNLSNAHVVVLGFQYINGKHKYFCLLCSYLMSLATLLGDNQSGYGSVECRRSLILGKLFSSLSSIMSDNEMETILPYSFQVLGLHLNLDHYSYMDVILRSLIASLQSSLSVLISVYWLFYALMWHLCLVCFKLVTYFYISVSALIWILFFCVLDLQTWI